MSPESFSERRVAADGFDVRLIEGGEGKPVVWIHGGGGLHMNAAFERLAERHRLTAFEIPGFGSTPENTRTRNFDELAQTLGEAVAAAGVVTPYALMGTSFGGAGALHMALAFPERISALVLLAPAAFRPDGWTGPAPENVISALYAHPERLPQRDPPDPSMMAKQSALLVRLLNTIDQPALRERIQQVRIPTLVVFGTEDGMIPPEMGRVYRQHMPNCSFVLLYDAGHEFTTDRPEASAELIDDFLDRREAFVIGQGRAPVAP
jgi:pimeloyl-ACP methyl ester carboxylesterase